MSATSIIKSTRLSASWPPSRAHTTWACGSAQRRPYIRSSKRRAICVWTPNRSMGAAGCGAGADGFGDWNYTNSRYDCKTVRTLLLSFLFLTSSNSSLTLYPNFQKLQLSLQSCLGVFLSVSVMGSCRLVRVVLCRILYISLGHAKFWWILHPEPQT